MNLFGFNLQISRTVSPPVQKSLSLPVSDWLQGEEGNGTSLVNAYEQVVWVYRAINALAEGLANVPFLFSSGERGREHLITSGPLLDFYARPHAHLNRFQYWELRVLWLMLRGECFRVPVYDTRRSSTGRPLLKQVLLPDPACFQHIIEDHQLIGWRFTGLGPQVPLASQVLLPEEVWFERLPNPFDFWRGLPPLQVAAGAARTDFAAGAFMRGLIENNADAGLIVRTDKWLSDEQREQIIAALRDRKRRAGRPDRPVLLLGTTEVIRPQLSSSDLQFLENRKFSRAEICAAFGVPEEIVTTTDHSKYDVMAGARLNFIENGIAPLCGRLEAEEDVTVKQIDPQASGWFDLESLPIFQEARRSRLTAARSGFEMGVPFNELNRVLDLGFRALPWGNRGYVPRQFQEVGAQEARAEAPSRSAENDHLQAPTNPPNQVLPEPRDTWTRAVSWLEAATPGKTDCHGVWMAGRQKIEWASSPQPSPPEEEREQPTAPSDGRSPKLSDSAANSPSAELLRKIRRFLFEQRCRALAGLPAWLKKSEGQLLDRAAENERLITQMKPFLEHELTQLSPDLTPSLVTSYLESRRPALEQHNQLTLDDLQQTLEQDRSESKSADEIAATTKAFFNASSATRAEEFALAETIAARTFAQSQERGRPRPRDP
jgi:HK97 family phage portal protein